MLHDVLVAKGLSNREAEVAGLVAKGLSNKEVCKHLFVTEKTIKFHLTNIYKKMGLKSRSQLIVWSLPHLGFVEEPKAIVKPALIVMSETTALKNLNQDQLPHSNK